MADPAPSQVDGPEAFSKDGPGIQARWTAELKLAQKEFEDYHDRCDKIESRYRCESDSEGGNLAEPIGRLQILWSTVQTQIPAVYQFPPEVEVSRRFKTKSPVARTASLILERYLQVDCDRDKIGDETLLVVLDRLLCDMGQFWVDYEPVVRPVPQPVAVMPGPDGAMMTAGGEPYTGPPPQPAPMAGNPDPTQPMPQAPMMGMQSFDKVVDCRAPATHLDIEDFLHSPARKWREVRWVARRHFWTRDECVEKYAKGMEQYGWTPQDIPLNSKAVMSKDDEDKTGDLFKRAEVWQIWDDKLVYFVCQGMSVPLEVRKRPLRLETAKWPCPMPYYGTMTNGSLIPVPSFIQWQELADEVDELTARIESLTRAIKLVGVRAADTEELDKLFQDTTDNELVPIDAWMAFKEKGGLKGAIEFIPMAEAMDVVVQLTQQRKERIDYIYQINGIGDILRGQGDPRATATQETIKATYGSLRLQQMQQDLAAFIERVLEIKAEIICEKAPPDVLIDVSAIEEVEPDRANIAAAVQMLRDNRVRDMRIDVDERSMVAMKDDEDKRSAIDFLGGIKPLIDSTMQAMQEAPAMLDVTGEALLFVARRYRAGREFEGTLEAFVDATRKQAEQARQAQSQQPPQPPLPLIVQQQKAADAQRLEDQRHQNKLQETAAESTADLTRERAQAESERAIELTRTQSRQQEAMVEGSVEARIAELEASFAKELEVLRARLRAQTDAARPHIVAPTHPAPGFRQ